MKRNVLIILLAIIVMFATACDVLGGGGGDGGETTPDPNAETPRQPDDDDEEVLPTNTPIPFTQVVIAVQNIPRGTVINPDVVDVLRFPAESVPSGAFAEEEDVIGFIAATDIFSEELVLSRNLVQDFSQLGSTGSDAAAVLDPGRVAVAVPIDRITSVAYALQPGDRVDVIVSMLFVDVDQDFQTILPNNMTVGRFFTGTETQPDGTSQVVREFDLPPFEGNVETYTFRADEIDSRSVGMQNTNSVTGLTDLTVRDDVILPVVIHPSEQQRPRLVTQRTVTDAQVIWVGEFPRDGRIFMPAATPTPIPEEEPTEVPEGEGEAVEPTTIPDRPTIVTLAVRPQDAVTLTYMAEAGIPMTFALRSARTQGLPDTSPVTLNYILATYNIAVPEANNYGIEPAIRSIRGITLENIFASGSATSEGNVDTGTDTENNEGN